MPLAGIMGSIRDSFGRVRHSQKSGRQPWQSDGSGIPTSAFRLIQSLGTIAETSPRHLSGHSDSRSCLFPHFRKGVTIVQVNGEEWSIKYTRGLLRLILG